MSVYVKVYFKYRVYDVFIYEFVQFQVLMFTPCNRSYMIDKYIQYFEDFV